ncbi:uncharacterized protein B0P05DRAFT_15068 [Gilbertella persicaria]|uniref:uncharacterized protein n=1 Tax=Gilbertella persicaria TaxID=101096 RepID=UPI00221FA29E|nr:uncharacterized protein B0P05DRAFT_15068 [Gilbertella persicaria]KAI8086904.1 hypothetical protein B0P05DRAFT_15068 [Gilbertella persicaria]
MILRIYLIELKLSVVKLERINELLECRKNSLCLVNSYFAADYIVTELKSPSRILRNTKEVMSTCPVVHVNWLIDSSISNDTLLDPKPYMIDVSAARKEQIPRALSPLPRQVTWEQLSEARRMRANEPMNHHTKYDERRLYYQHKGRKTKYRERRRYRKIFFKVNS